MEAQIAEILSRGKRALFITGAGISADSGLPTYRGVGGLYENAATEEGFPVEVALSGPLFGHRPDITWRHLLQIEEACRGAKPNRGHEVIAALEQHLEVVVFTQNVDGLHRVAGSSRVIEIHGTIHDLRCTACGWRDQVQDFADLERPVPTCPSCGSVIRPDVVLFEEMLPEDALSQWEEELDRGFDVVFSVGTSSQFPYIMAPMVTAARARIPTVEINPTPSDLAPLMRFQIPERAAVALDRIYSELNPSNA